MQLFCVYKKDNILYIYLLSLITKINEEYQDLLINLNEFENVLREISQKIILYALSQTSFFKNAAFYGGTCLRIFHNLDRFSEDLDFQVISEDYKLDFDQYMSKCINVLESYGLKATVYTKPDYDKGEVRRRYIKISHYV